MLEEVEEVMPVVMQVVALQVLAVMVEAVTGRVRELLVVQPILVEVGADRTMEALALADRVLLLLGTLPLRSPHSRMAT
tara:strand:- start:328 stop:564 length:237 start_codon:yes stop_codon:yes gene_type:complete